MTEGGWRPLSHRAAGLDPAIDGPFEGVPAWLRAELWQWVERAVLGPPSSSLTAGAINEFAWLPRLRSLARALRMPLESISDGQVRYDVPLARLHALASNDDELFLNVVDYMLANYKWVDRPSLETLLGSAGSAWRVKGQGDGLERRVDATATSQMSAAVAEGGRPAAHLAIAWSAAFGRNPDPSKAYAEALKAVEAAVIPVVIPNQATPTLGKAIGQLRSAPGKFRVIFGPADQESRVSSVAEMLDLLWAGHHDRHGSADHAAPMAVSQPEAEAAVHIAVTLVQLFKSGFVTRS